MKITPASEQQIEDHAQDIADLVHQTGPVPYDYQFGTKDLLDRFVKRSLPIEGTLFGREGLNLAIDGDEILGILFSFPGTEFRKRIAAQNPMIEQMLAKEEVTMDEISGLIERAGHSSWLNPELHPGTYYIHAIAVKPKHRGKQIGVQLISHAMELGQEQGCKRLQLDVMSDNPAVHFYQSQGLEILAETTAPKPRENGVPPEYRMGIRL